ncbi:MAG: phage terminase large subunit [Oscillospiraceae bacterium]
MPNRVLELNERQKLFFKARRRFIAYGGARGGGKTWAVREKADVLAHRYPGINILIVRRTYPELLQNHILPMQLELSGLAHWNDKQKRFIFPNGSNIWFGYCSAERDVLRYQGQEYDIIFIDEATQLTEYQFQTFKGCLRGVSGFPKRMYLTCNPGGVGHAWVKRLFIDRLYHGDERADDYEFIQAKVTDNPVLMERDPEYISMLESLPYELREAWLNGSWDVFAGQYFSEWDRDVHVVAPFEPPAWWRRYVTIDYGLDMLAAYLIAVDEHDMAYVIREVYQGRDLGEGAKGLIVSEAAQAVLDMVGGDKVTAYLAPPDLWAARQETGRSVADIFTEHGIALTKTSNDRLDGWMAMHERLHVFEDEQGRRVARLRIFPGCANLIRTLPQLRYDDKRVNDVATEPHELTHAADAIRGFCVYWVRAAHIQEAPARMQWTRDMLEDYRRASPAGKRFLEQRWGPPGR